LLRIARNEERDGASRTRARDDLGGRGEVGFVGRGGAGGIGLDAAAHARGRKDGGEREENGATKEGHGATFSKPRSTSAMKSSASPRGKRVVPASDAIAQ